MLDCPEEARHAHADPPDEGRAIKTLDSAITVLRSWTGELWLGYFDLLLRFKDRNEDKIQLFLITL